MTTLFFIKQSEEFAISDSENDNRTDYYVISIFHFKLTD